MILLLRMFIWVMSAALVSLGLSFVTHRLRWAVFVDKSKLHPVLLTPHNDWGILRFIKRYMTAFVNTPKPWEPPIKLFGTAPKDGHLDIVPPHTWVLAWPAYFTARWTKRQFRLGMRPDYAPDPETGATNFDIAYYTVAFSPWDRVD